MAKNKSQYDSTLNLPKTLFEMRAGLPKKEPVMLKDWDDNDLYNQLMKHNEGKPQFILHDGPPYANGNIHMGTALNKIIKDIIIRDKNMEGFQAPYVPGFDTHGLPIELKALSSVGDKKKDISKLELRQICEKFATEHIDIMSDQFKRLGVIGDFEHPYLTLKPEFEARQIEIFGEMAKKGYIYKGLKPVYWCPDCRTALAEAEIEYGEDDCDSIFVRFHVSQDPNGVLAKHGIPMDKTYFVIWTTTTWTLPANEAICLNGQFEYSFVKIGDEFHIMATELVKSVMDACHIENYEIVGEPVSGAEFELMRYNHVYLPKEGWVILGDHVTLESGSGCVHTAGGHGVDDFNVCQKYPQVPITVPVDDGGYLTELAGKYAGQRVWAANKTILADLTESGAVMGQVHIKHQYPHCWRCHHPIIFRATEQWFCSIAKFREDVYKAIDTVTWMPDWGHDRMKGMVRDRNDWCISRQRTWGVPLPVFFDEDGKAVLDAALVRKIADMVEAHGSNIWFELSDEALCERLGLPKTWKKGKDTLDVWIDSGSSHMAVMDSRPGLDAPADLYLEATDQHRGWFQSSLMLSVAWRGTAPYKAVMTHGFVVDKDTGKKTSKSDAKSGKPIDAAYYYDKYGADIVRLWAASVDWQNEVPFGEDLFKQVTEPYRRLRNTLRILLGNINGFDFATQAVSPEHMPILDRWILERLNAVIRETLKAYEAYDFRKAFSVINQFCTSDLSALYVDTTKDRLYCDSVTSVRRRATLTAMTIIFKALCRLLAPILAFTADEAWEYAGYEGSVHEQDFPAPMPEYDTQEASSVVSRLLEIKSVIQVAIEEQVKAKTFSKNNEADIRLTVPSNESEDVVALLEDRAFCTEFFIIADLSVQTGPELAATALRTEHAMCPRCRRYEPEEEGADVCERCSEVLS